MTTENPNVAPPPAAMSRHPIIRRLAYLCCGGAAMAFILMETAGSAWPVVLLTPYSPQWAAIALIGVALLVPLLIRRPRRRWDVALLAAGGVAAIHGGAVTLGLVPWRTIQPTARVTVGDANFGRIKILLANVHTSNADHRTLLDVIAEENPDVILLPEVDDRWAADLRVLNERYPTHTTMPDSLGNFGFAFFSRLPGDAVWTIMKDPHRFEQYDVPQMDATLRLTDAAGRSRPIRVIGLHPLPPTRIGNTQARDAVLIRTGDTVAATPNVPAIVVGDLNATRYCAIAQRLCRPAALRDAASPLRFSWPNTWSWWAMGIRIDHVLATDAWRVVDVHAGRDIRSDHMPIVATLQLIEPNRD